MSKSVLINGVTYTDVPSVSIPLSAGSGNAEFFDTTDATAQSADVLNGKSAYGASGKMNGGMTNNGAVSGNISTKEGQYTIPLGYHNGNGKVGIAAAEQAKIVSGNIKSGVTILGVAGKSSVVETSDADATASTILNGKTAYVNGAKVTGTFTAAVISQDSTTKVLSIA